MQPFTRVTGRAAPLPAANIDTDVIMPKQFLKGIDRAGLDRGLFHGLRFDQAGQERPGFILNQAPWRGASFLVVGPNFGCGSSREHAVWGLKQLGIRAVIGTSFAGIFFDNCARNGLLAISLDEDAIGPILQTVSDPNSNELTIDLPHQTIAAPGGVSIRFQIEPGRKEALVKGLDAIGVTLSSTDQIVDFEKIYLEQNPWLA